MHRTVCAVFLCLGQARTTVVCKCVFSVWVCVCSVKFVGTSCNPLWLLARQRRCVCVRGCAVACAAATAAAAVAAFQASSARADTRCHCGTAEGDTTLWVCVFIMCLFVCT